MADLLVDDDFHQITPAPAGDAPNWNLTTESDSVAHFVDTSADQPIVLGVSTGEAYVARAQGPRVVDQMAEIKCQFATSISDVAYTGVFLRYYNKSNCVIARINHQTKQAELIERIANVDTVLASPTVTADVGASGASIKLELIGSRWRLWYEPNRMRVLDMPPDLAGDLAGTYTQPGDWGVYLVSPNSSNGIEVQHFYARNLPDHFAPPPDINVFDASGLAMTAITATYSPDSNTNLIEWQVFPNDADDFAEGYTDLSAPAVTERVFYVRAGYPYVVRARSLSRTGTIGDWSSASFTAAGSKVGPSSPTMPDDDWPDVDPDYVLSRTQTANAGAVVADTGRERVFSQWVRPRNSWAMKFEDRSREDIQKIMDFFDAMNGRELPFKWVHPISGEIFAVRFDTDDLNATVKDEGPDGAIFTLDVPIMEVAVGVVSTITVSLEIDPDLILAPEGE